MDTEAVYQKPTEEEVKTLLTEKFPGIVEITKLEERRIYGKLKRENVHEVMTYIRDNLTYEHCSVVMGVDYIDHMTVVYLISNYWNGHMIELDVDLPNDDLHVESVTDLWQGANWHERETYELFGIIFDNHPKLERLLTPKTYEFYPFRKSYKLRSQE